jgi:signal transduction histidine kinase
MSPNELEKAFEPGFSTKGGGQGGLGLSISWLIVDAHGGELTLSSQVGHGTKASIRLPPSGNFLTTPEEVQRRDRDSIHDEMPA